MIRVLVLALLAGCELFVPQGSLAVEDGDCTTGETVCEQPTSVCDPATATCVECLLDNDCPGERPFCNAATTTCSATCVADAQCETGACLPDGTCAEASRILYATVGGTGDCTRENKCAIETALTLLVPGVDVIQLDTGTYDLAATLIPSADVTFNGTDVTLRSATGDTLLQFNTVVVKLHRITLESVGGFGVFCQTNGTLEATRVRADGGAVGIIGLTCSIRIDRSHISSNTSYGIFVTRGPFVLTNSYVTKNGVPTGQLGGILLDDLMTGSVIEHNTIADNVNDTTMPSGLCRCNGMMFTAVIRNNIIRGNSIAPECTVANNVIDAGYTGAGMPNNVADPGFVNSAANDYRLMPGSPVAGMSDPTSPIVFVDFDNDARPLPAGSNPDPGADEIP